MKKWIERTYKRIKDSKYTFPFIFFLVFFTASGIFMYIIEAGRNNQFQNPLDGFWWSLITFSTTGYGDLVPITLGGRILALLTIFIGIGAMSFLSGTLASIFVDRNSRARRGLMDFPKIKDHFIICGWKDHMKDILVDIIEVSGQLSADKIIIISNIPAERIEELKENPNLKGIKYVKGDYFSESTLERANVKSAWKVLILADSFESSAPSEVDSKTVMTVLTIKAIAKDVYICAELLDKKFESYLKQAMCDEIVYSRDFSRRMLASTSATSGLSHIVYSLVSKNNTNSRLLTEPLPEKFIGQAFEEVKKTFETDSKKLVIGILENTGSPNRMKIEALREAQKTSDVSRLVTNLQEVKSLEVNKPVLLPANDYIIPNYSRVILLERLT